MQYTESIEKKTNNVSFICMLYILSTLLEPLLLFVILERETSGIGGNISRFFQSVVVLYLILTFLAGKINIKIFNK